MGKYKQRQALALTSRHQQQVALPGFHGTAIAALEEEAAKIVAEDTEKRTNGGISGCVVADAGRISGFLKDGHTTVRFGGGAIAIATHD